MSSLICQHTPALHAIDSRGLSVRDVAYHRAVPGLAAQLRATRVRCDVAGRRRELWDPRLSARLEQGEPLLPSQVTVTSLSGRPLLDESADGGWQLTLPGETAQPRLIWDGRGSHWQREYDESLRLLAIRETAAGQPVRVAERFDYGGEAQIIGNGRGRLVRQDDEGGSRSIPGYDLAGQPLGEVRHFLEGLDLPDWPASPAARDSLLEGGDGAVTVQRHGPLGELLEQTDAIGNRQRWQFNRAGALVGVTLQWANGVEQRLACDIRYNVCGQIMAQACGNGAVQQAEYDPADGRLRRLTTSRPGTAAIQDLLYAYDPVGNVRRIEDLSQPVSHFANQRVDAVNSFCYDSLYQLSEAVGREAAGALIGPGLPDLAPLPGDTSRLLNYRQHYDYDASGNLLSLRHVGSHSYRRHMAVADISNHALPWVDDVAPENPRAGFDDNGNLLDLQAGQPLSWSAGNRLHGIRQVGRAHTENDEEHYRYGGDGLRLRKVSVRQVAGRMRQGEVRYLPGLELRECGARILAMVTLRVGRCVVRCLHWLAGAPEGADHPQLRYSLADPHDSAALELDGKAQIISHEGYYPFGGTAWWAGRSEQEAGHKVRRYSGKERDVSGLYDFGLRYYAPWLARWISADPAGDADGLNRFAMVSNNPVTVKDQWGLMGGVEEVRSTAANAVARARQARRLFVEQKMIHRFPGDHMVGSHYLAPDRSRSEFANEFRPQEWTLLQNFKRTATDEFHASDVLSHQYRLAAARYGFEGKLPSMITLDNVINDETMLAVGNLDSGSEEMAKTFVRTPLGKLVSHLGAEHGFETTAVTMIPLSRARTAAGAPPGRVTVANIHVQVRPLTLEATPLAIGTADTPPPLPTSPPPLAVAHPPFVHKSQSRAMRSRGVRSFSL